MKSRVAPSAQCRSSIASSTGPERPSRSSRASSPSNRRPWRVLASSSAPVPVPPSSGSSSASALRVAAGREAASSRASPRASGRSAATSGAYGICAPPSSRHWPISTRAPRSRARDSNSRRSRVLPTPDSPAMNANAGRPPAARSRAPSSVSSSAPRPTKVGEATRRAMTPLSRTASDHGTRSGARRGAGAAGSLARARGERGRAGDGHRPRRCAAAVGRPSVWESVPGAARGGTPCAAATRCVIRVRTEASRRRGWRRPCGPARRWRDGCDRIR